MLVVLKTVIGKLILNKNIKIIWKTLTQSIYIAATR